MQNIIHGATQHYQRAKHLYQKYERVLMPAMLVIGFVVDYITFANIQIKTTFLLLLFYWVATGMVILFSHWYDSGKAPAIALFNYVRLFTPLFLQFAFGALLSASLIFYWFSGAFSVSWPLILLIALLMVSNDVFRRYFAYLSVQIGVYFFATFSLLSLFFPYLFTSLSAWLFVASGVISIVLFLPFIYLLSLQKENSKVKRWQLFVVIGGIFVAMNGLYFFNIIPPIPLALRDAGVYHDLTISNGTYVMYAERTPFFGNWFGGPVVHLEQGEKIYVYTAIFAPAELKTTIVHDWQWYDETSKDWVNNVKGSFVITGGRREGYKGYSFNSSLAVGKWRVSVTNQRGQVLGRVHFKVAPKTEPLDLIEVVR